MKYTQILKAIFICCLTLNITGITAQNSSLVYYLENLPQTNYTNPAMLPRANGFLGLPGISSIGFSFKTDIAPKDLLQKSGDTWVHPLNAAFDYKPFYNSIGKSSVIKTAIDYAPIYFGFRTKNGYFTFSLKEKANMRIGLPKDFFSIADDGFGNGKTLDLKTLETKIISYHEISIGYAHKIDKHLTVGAHLKPLFGMAAAHMKFKQFTLENRGTQYYMGLDATANTSIPLVDISYDEDGVPEDVTGLDDIEGSDISQNIGPNFKNFGLALDLGAVYDLNNKWSFSAALNNLGYIKWKDNLNNLSAKGNYTFTGPDMSYSETDDIEDVYEKIGDEVIDAIRPDSTKQSFTTTLAPELMIGSLYHVNHVFSLGFLSRSTFEKFNFRQQFVFSGNLNLYKFLTANIAYNHEINGSKDLGLGLGLRAGPAQLYILANHIPFYYDRIEDNGDSYIAPTKAECFSLMFGINLVFGKHGYKDKPMIN